ncbi:MAG: FkbM family methyltransferase [Kiloniellaceae bacterium]
MLALIRRARHGPLRGWAPMWTILGRLYRGTLDTLNLRTTVTMRIGPYGPFKLDGRFAFSNYEAWGGGKNAGFQACVEASSGARCVLDVGAHIGLVSLPMSRAVAPGGRVYVFEPADFNRALLRRHVALNGADNIEVVGDLVGERDENEVAFYEKDADTGLNTVAVRPGQSSFFKTRKRQICLDTFCERRGLEPDVIKIDVEGAEVGVLRGAVRTLRRFRPIIFLSVHPRQLRLLGHDVAELSRLIGEFGYDCRSVSGSEVSELEGQEYLLQPRGAAGR